MRRRDAEEDFGGSFGSPPLLLPVLESIHTYSEERGEFRLTQLERRAQCRDVRSRCSDEILGARRPGGLYAAGLNRPHFPHARYQFFEEIFSRSSLGGQSSAISRRSIRNSDGERSLRTFFG
jgi:hypothetical protein